MITNPNIVRLDDERGEIQLQDFVAYMPTHSYIFAPTRELWPASSVNQRVPSPLSPSGKPIPPNVWLDQNRPVEQMTWCPGLPMLIRDRLVSDGGWINRSGVTTFNLYRPPIIAHGDPNKAGRWLDHVRKVYPNDADHIIKWSAHRVQKRARRSITPSPWAASRASVKVQSFNRSSAPSVRGTFRK